MGTLDYLVILAYFIGLIAVSVIMSRKIRSFRGHVPCRKELVVVAFGNILVHDDLLREHIRGLGRCRL